MQQDLFTKKMTQAQIALIKRLTDTLANMGCKYYVKTLDGDVFSLGLKPAENAAPAPAPQQKASKRAPLKYPYGYLTNYVRPYLENIQPGQVAEIPYHNTLSPREVANAASKEANRKWGKGAYTVVLNDKTRTVELLRTDGM